MKKIIFTIALLISFNCYADTLTVNTIPKAQTGGTSPKIKDSQITDNGTNVGIATTAPSQKLEVIGSVKATAFIGDITGDVTGTASSASALESATSTVDVSAATSPTSGQVLTATGAFAATWQTPSGGGGSGTINSGTTNRAPYYSGATTLSSSTKIFNDNTNVGIGTIAPRTSVEIGTRTMNINGTNVGIGSITPGQALDIQGSARATSFVSTPTSTPNVIFDSNTSTNTSDSKFWFGINGDSGNDNDDNLIVSLGSTAATPVVSVRATNGNVGIGTSIAPNALYVVGTPMFTTGLNVGIGTASATRLCIANNAVTTCP